MFDYNDAKLQLSKYSMDITQDQFEQNKAKNVILGMSGGVDSSVCAVILKLQGYNVRGFFMKNWEEIDEYGACTSQEDYKDVQSVCEHLDIEYYGLNFAKEYKQRVFDQFVEDYKSGHTPNPDIFCNKEIKFNVFYNKAMQLGADFIATGHYCQKDEQSQLLKGEDLGKDQTYFLYTIKQDVLKNVLFPIGSLQKSTVRQIAQDFGLANHDKKDSTGICFIGERNFKEFLSQYISKTKGRFVNFETKKVMGEHDGACFYTIGQRKGLGLGGPGGPWFVQGKNMATNEVYVVEGENNKALMSQKIIASEVSWVCAEPEFPLRCRAKIRYRQPDQACIVDKNQRGELVVEFSEPQRAVAKRQSIVFYKENVCLGGAIILSSPDQMIFSS